MEDAFETKQGNRLDSRERTGRQRLVAKIVQVHAGNVSLRSELSVDSVVNSSALCVTSGP